MTGRKAEGARCSGLSPPRARDYYLAQTLVLQPPHQAPQLLAS